MMKYLPAILILFLNSCQSNNVSIRNSKKLTVNFQPAFNEASEITFIDSGSIRQAYILIKKNFRIDITEDTLYYMTINLKDNEVELIVDSILKQWDYSGKQKKLTILDGMPISFQQIHNNDTLRLQYNNPSKEDSSAYGLTVAALTTYQTLFKDSIVSDYFRLLHTYLNGETFAENKLTPFMRLQEEKYEGQLRYNR